MTEQVIIAISSCPDEATAQRLASALVQERLATIPATGGNEQYLEWVRSGVADETQRT